MTAAPPLFWTETRDLQGERIVLGGAEGHHAAAVRRVEAGESVDLADGHGTRVRCEVVSVGRNTVDCAVRERAAEPQPRPAITVVQALPKGDRGELAVELMTEAGVDSIVPWQAQRCVARWKGDRTAKSLRKWRGAARDAAKQARRARIPSVAEPADLAEVVRRLRGAALGVALDGGAGARLAQTAVPGGGEVVVVVGPEGGLAPQELAAMAEAGAIRATLGPSVLRTSTAGVVALAVIQAMSGRI